MALPSVGGGYQFTDGNTNELEIDTQAAPQTATSTATLTTTQILVACWWSIRPLRPQPYPAYGDGD
jgi:hypothetical protein